jgi:hypothetical protein
MTWCHDCGHPNDWVPALWTALAITLGVAVGYFAQIISERLGSRFVGIVLMCTCLAVVSVRLWIETASMFTYLPLCGVLAGLFHRRQKIQSPFANRV